MRAQCRKAMFWVILSALMAFDACAVEAEEAPPAGSATPEPPAPPPVAPGPNAATPSTTETPAQTTVLDSPESVAILGRGVLSKTGEKMGQIIDMIVDRNGQVRAAVIDFGGFLGVGSRKIAVDWSAVHFVSNGKSLRVVVDLTKDQLKGSPEYKPGEEVVILGAAPASSAWPALPQK